MALIRWTPWHELESINRQLSRMLDESPDGEERGNWLPAVDIHESEDMFTVEAEVPGIDKKDIKVSVENGMLTISGERRYEKETKEENRHRIERSYGRFTRSFALPTHVDSAKVVAKVEDGVLRVTLPKVEAVKPKSIEVR